MLNNDRSQNVEKGETETGGGSAAYQSVLGMLLRVMDTLKQW